MMTGVPVPVNAQGEICCRGYQNMRGYYDMAAETAATIDADGWLHMGDIGSMDDRGFLRVTSRVKDMIIRGGMNLYPAEIEAVLQDHPAVETAAVIGVPDQKWGEQVAAVLRVRADATRPTAAELTEFLRDQIAPHKIPVFWSFVDGLPMTPTGKTQKFILRQQVTDGTLTFDEIRPSKSATAP
jgi:fatty-acyl-CoA synthase